LIERDDLRLAEIRDEWPLAAMSIGYSLISEWRPSIRDD